MEENKQPHHQTIPENRLTPLQHGTWVDSSTKLTTPRSISTTAKADRSSISYDPYLYTHVFTKVNIYPIQQTTFGSVLHTYFYPPFGAQNAIVGQATMTNAFDGRQ
jgi:hypothetical protein